MINIGGGAMPKVRIYELAKMLKIENKELIEKLKELIATLPERQRKVINLHLGFYEGPRLKLTDKCVMAELSQPTFSKTVIEV